MTHRKENLLFKPWKEIKRLQDKKLHYFITRKLYPFSPYYRQLFDKNNICPDTIRTVGDLRRLPLVSKNDFFNATDGKTEKSRDFILQPNEKFIRKFLPKTELLKFSCLSLLKGKDYLKNRLEKEYRPIFLAGTAGTTGQPLSCFYTNYDLENLQLYGRRMVEIFNMKKHEVGVNTFPYAPHLAFWQVVFAGIGAGVFILSTGGGKTMGTEGNLRSILKAKPQFLIGVPGYIYHLLKTARRRNLDLHFVTNIVLGASRVPEGFKKKLANLLKEMNAPKVKVFGTYGFTEARAAWPECPTDIGISSGYHTYPDKAVFEVIDPKTGMVKGEGEDGELVYTNIDSRGTCVLRYRTGDLVRGGISYFPCPYCGRTVPRISSDIARASNIQDIKFSRIKDTYVDLDDLEHFLDGKEEIDEWQIEILRKDNDPYELEELELYVSLLKDVDKNGFAKQLNSEILSTMEVAFNKINFVSFQEMQRRLEVESSIKVKKIVDKRLCV
ncbi:MAG: AMP-binding protein [Elusimicrobia bacterium]|nr:AMP-binding protein [Candidatus Omnitrophota bacterium]MCG2725019.1 AMP-binding protein [Elusimicrobiota bacterium]